MVADDLALLSTKTGPMQQAIKIAETHANQERYLFSETKTRTVHMPSKPKKNNSQGPVLTLNSKAIEPSAIETHLGIPRPSNSSNLPAIEMRTKAARRSAYSLFGAGFHGLNGVGVECIHKQWISCVRPTLTYGLEALTLSANEIKLLETFTRKMLRRLQFLPDSTAIPAIYLLFGVEPIEATIHRQVLSLLGNICRRPGSVERGIIERQAVMCSPNDQSWINNAKHILKKYSLPSIFSLLEQTPNKSEWKTSTRNAVTAYWEKELKEEASHMTSLQHLDLENCTLQKPHPVWGTNLSNPHCVTKATVQAQLLIMRYPLYGQKVAGKKKTSSCPLCNTDSETMDHFLLQCQALQPYRIPHLSTILTITRFLGADICNLSTYIVNPSLLKTLNPTTSILARSTRELCYTLHMQRRNILNRTNKTRQPPVQLQQLGSH